MLPEITIQMRTKGHIIAALITYLADYLIPPFYRRLFTCFYLAKSIRVLWVGDSSKPFALTTCAGILIAFLAPARTTLTVFFGVRLFLKHVLFPAMRSIDYWVTNEQNQIDIIFGPVPLVFYGLTFLILENGVTLWSFLLRALLSPIAVVVLLAMGTWTMLLDGDRRSQLKGYCGTGLDAVRRVAAWLILRVPDTLTAPIIAVINVFERWDALQIEKQESRTSGNASPAAYRYQQFIRPPDKKVRLLRILPRKVFTRLRCELVDIDLDQAPKFEAISYTWDHQKPIASILVDGCRLMVTPNVEEIVGYFQSFLGDRYLWIDGVCINQEDMDEKKHQVTLMRDIYQLASRVVVWLGPQGGTSDAYLARTLLCFLAHAKAHNHGPPEEFLRMVSRRGDPGWPAVIRLFAHPWFSRAWVVQEMALATRLQIIYGGICMDWNLLAAGIDILLDPFIIGTSQTADGLNIEVGLTERIRRIGMAGVMAYVRSQVQGGCDLPLGLVLGACISFEATDARDKVFSILGITLGSLHENLAPDYQKSDGEVYLDVMRHIVSTGNKHEVDLAFQFAGVGFHRSSKMEIENLPSWVPNWSVPPTGRILHRASISDDVPGEPEQGVKFRFADDKRLLKVEGVEIDRIKDIGGVWEPDKIQDPIEQIYAIRAWLNGIRSIVQACSKELYPTDEADNEAVWQVLKAASWRPENEYNTPASLSKAWNVIENMLDSITSMVDPIGENVPLDDLLIELRPIEDVIGRAGEKRFCVTQEGRLSFVPPKAKRDNLICSIEGLQMPVVLREKQDQGASTAELYELLGCCIIYGTANPRTTPEVKWYKIE